VPGSPTRPDLGVGACQTDSESDIAYRTRVILELAAAFAMARFDPRTMLLWGSLGLTFASGAVAGNTYEPTHPPRIVAIGPEARSFYLEFRARNEVGGFGHAYVILATVDGVGRVHENVVAGFMPESADDDYWSKFGVPVRGLVGVARSDFTRRPDARFRIAISKGRYFQILRKIRRLRDSWTVYQLLAHNCNSFVDEVASLLALRTPILTLQYPVHYVTELRALNSR
jgi:hypothetical protein